MAMTQRIFKANEDRSLQTISGDTDEVNISRVKQMLDCCRYDAEEQLSAVIDMIVTTSPEDVHAMAVIAMAAENAAKNVERLYQLSVIGGGHELVCPTR
jgi:hypothetical protein